MSTRVVFWREDYRAPLWRIAPRDEILRLRLHKVPWVFHACDNWPYDLVEVFSPQDGEWRTRPLNRWEFQFRDARGTPTILLRKLGVKHCAGFGLELEGLYRELGLRNDPQRIPVQDNREDYSRRPIRTMAWTEDNVDPVLHVIDVNERNQVLLDLHPELCADLQERRIVSLWLPEEGEWEFVCRDRGFHYPSKFDTMLLKLSTTQLTPGFGREMSALDALIRRNDGDVFGQDYALTRWEDTMYLASGVSPYLDLAVSTARQTRQGTCRVLDRIEEQTIFVSSRYRSVLGTSKGGRDDQLVSRKRPRDAEGALMQAARRRKQGRNAWVPALELLV